MGAATKGRARSQPGAPQRGIGIRMASLQDFGASVATARVRELWHSTHQVHPYRPITDRVESSARRPAPGAAAPQGMSVLPGEPGWLARLPSRRLACASSGIQPAGSIHPRPLQAGRAESSAKTLDPPATYSGAAVEVEASIPLAGGWPAYIVSGWSSWSGRSRSSHAW